MRPPPPLSLTDVVALALRARSKPLLEALAGLSRLKDIDIASSEGSKPFIVTTARLFKLMQRSWPDLEVLHVTNLKPAEDGPQEEEDDMWELVEEIEEAAWEKRQAEKQGKKDQEGEGDEGADADKGKGKEVVAATDAGDDKKDRPKPRGLKVFRLAGFNMTGSEMDLLLQDVRPSFLSQASHGERVLTDGCRYACSRPRRSRTCRSTAPGTSSGATSSHRRSSSSVTT